MFSERSTFFSAHFWTTAAASHHKLYIYCCKAQHSSFVNIHIEFSKPMKYDFQTHDENKTIALTDICKVRA